MDLLTYLYHRDNILTSNRCRGVYFLEKYNPPSENYFFPQLLCMYALSWELYNGISFIPIG